MTVRTVDLTPRAFTTDANYDYYRSQIDDIRARVAELEARLAEEVKDRDHWKALAESLSFPNLD